MNDHHLQINFGKAVRHDKETSDKLQGEVSTLKSAISQLLSLPAGINVDVDKQLSSLKQALGSNQEAKIIQQRVELLILVLVAAVSNFKHTKSTGRSSMGQYIKHGTALLNQLLGQMHDTSHRINSDSLLDGQMDDNQQMAGFIQLLSECVAAVGKKVVSNDPNHVQPERTANNDIESLHLVMSQDVNQSLKQLIQHLSIPEEYSQKLNQIMTILESEITGEKLTCVIDQLTEIIVEVFNLEQTHFKGFLQDVTSQLHNFDTYLKFNSEQSQEYQNESHQLESGIQSNIKEIHQHIDTSTTIEELSGKINQNLEAIGERMKTFKSNELKRFDEQRETVKLLQEKLMESERKAEAIQNMLYFEQEKTNQDSLTGLPNRGAYDERILKAYNRYQRGYGELSLAVADIDFFKKINDNYGHLAGDKVLKKVAAIFNSSIRQADFISRYGGEEFVFIFERTTEDSAKKILESLRTAIEGCQFSYRDNKVNVTVSLGLATVKPDDTPESVFMRADAAMYRAKCNGRNRVEC